MWPLKPGKDNTHYITISEIQAHIYIYNNLKLIVPSPTLSSVKFKFSRSLSVLWLLNIVLLNIIIHVDTEAFSPVHWYN